MQFNGTIDQIAYISHSETDTRRIKEALGLQDADWTEDICVASGEVRGKASTNKARLLFNYDMGVEVEILQYLEGDNYASNLSGGRICHIGIHHDGGGVDVPTFPGRIIQQVVTETHTNPFLLETGRQYRYTIYDTLGTLGVYTKVIERIEATPQLHQVG
jgi:hypothetical protein